MVSQNHVYLEKEREIPSSDVAIVKLTVRRRLNSSDTAEAQSRSKPQSQGLYVSERTPATKAELGRPHHKHAAANGGVVNLESAKTLLIVSEFNQAARGRSILSVSNSKSARIDSSRTARTQKLVEPAAEQTHCHVPGQEWRDWKSSFFHWISAPSSQCSSTEEHFTALDLSVNLVALRRTRTRRPRFVVNLAVRGIRWSTAAAVIFSPCKWRGRDKTRRRVTEWVCRWAS